MEAESVAMVKAGEMVVAAKEGEAREAVRGVAATAVGAREEVRVEVETVAAEKAVVKAMAAKEVGEMAAVRVVAETVEGARVEVRVEAETVAAVKAAARVVEMAAARAAERWQ